ncbi:MAG: translation initiation factor IF-1 [Verrucomicrobiales bacterium]|jgi:translation initiation factor IF-1
MDEAKETGPSRPPIQGVGELFAIHENGLHSVRMANGYEVNAILERSLKSNPDVDLAPGDQVLVEFSPYNMTQARILRRNVLSGVL